MTTAILDAVPAEQLLTDARQVKPGRVLLTILGALGIALGWSVSKTLTGIGWTTGRVFLTGAYFVEAVVYGFRAGANLPPRQPGAMAPR